MMSVAKDETLQVSTSKVHSRQKKIVLTHCKKHRGNKNENQFLHLIKKKTKQKFTQTHLFNSFIKVTVPYVLQGTDDSNAESHSAPCWIEKQPKPSAQSIHEDLL